MFVAKVRFSINADNACLTTYGSALVGSPPMADPEQIECGGSAPPVYASPSPEPDAPLDTLVAGITENNRHDEIGNEPNASLPATVSDIEGVRFIYGDHNHKWADPLCDTALAAHDLQAANAELRAAALDLQAEAAEFRDKFADAVRECIELRTRAENAEAEREEMRSAAFGMSADVTTFGQKLDTAIRERDEARAERDASVRFIAVLGEELVLAGLPAGDRSVILANVRALPRGLSRV
jgi:hypothetical protein